MEMPAIRLTELCQGLGRGLDEDFERNNKAHIW